MFGGTTYAAGGGMIGEGRHKEKMSPKLTREMAQRDKATQAPGGEYTQKLREKLTKIYVMSPQQKSGVMPQPMGEVKNLPVGSKSNIQYTKNNRVINKNQFDIIGSLINSAKTDGAGGVVNNILNRTDSIFGGIIGKVRGAINNPKSFVENTLGGTVKDGNVGQIEERSFAELERNKARLATSQQRLNALGGGISPPSQPPVTVIPVPQGQSAPSYGKGGGQPADQLPTFSASGNSRDRSRTSEILGIF